MFPTKVPRVRSPRRIPSGDGKQCGRRSLTVQLLLCLFFLSYGMMKKDCIAIVRAISVEADTSDVAAA